MNSKTPVIMVIEDEELLLQAISKKLELNDIKVVSCVSGKQAIDYLRNLPQLPDGIWLDYYLKDMNGLEFMRELNSNKKWAGIPVLVVSNSASSEKVRKMINLGARKYLLKAEHRLDDIVKTMKHIIA